MLKLAETLGENILQALERAFTEVDKDIQIKDINPELSIIYEVCL